MTEEEFWKSYAKVDSTDHARAARMYALWKEDPSRGSSELEVLSSTGPAADIKKDATTTRKPISHAMGISDDQVYDFFDSGSKNYWGNYKTKDLIRIALDAGAVDWDFTDPVARKYHGNFQPKIDEQRAKFQNFMDYLSANTQDVEHKKAVNEYLNDKSIKGTVQRGINHYVFPTLETRLLQQAAKGQGPSSWGTMGSGDWATLGGDMGAGAMYGAGASGFSKAILANTARRGALPLAGYGNVLASNAGAGALGATTQLVNTDLNTEADPPLGQYAGGILGGAVGNTVLAPVVAKGMLNQAVRPLKRTNSKYTAPLREAAKLFDENPEAEFAAFMRDQGAKFGSTPDKSYMTRETVKELNTTIDKFNSFNAYEPQLGGALTDFYRQLNDRNTQGVVGDHFFLSRLGDEIERLKSVAQAEGATKAGKEAKMLADYYENAYKLFDSGILDPHRALAELPEMPTVPNVTRDNQYVLKPSTADAMGFALNDPSLRDYEMMRNIVEQIGNGKTVIFNRGTMSQEVRDLMERYPEFKKWYESLSTAKPSDLTVKKSADEFFKKMDKVKKLQYDPERPAGGYGLGGNEIRIDYNTPLAREGFGPRSAFLSTDNLLRQSLSGAGDVVKGAIVSNSVGKGLDLTRESPERVKKQFEELKNRKPQAVDDALNLKVSWGLGDNVLTQEELDLVDRYREVMRKERRGQRD